VVVHRPVGPSARVAKKFGWRGKTDPAIFPLELLHRRAIATADPVTKAWTERAGGIRVFLLTSAATFLVNCDSDGWRFEPGSLDSELFATPVVPSDETRATFALKFGNWGIGKSGGGKTVSAFARTKPN